MPKQLKCKSYDFKNNLFSDNATGLWASEESAKLDLSTLKAMFYSEDWVYITVDLIASEISAAPLKIYSKNLADDGSLQVNEAHELNKLIKNPNKYQDETSFKYCMGVEYALMGNSCVAYMPKLNQLIPMQSEAIELQFDGVDVSTYTYTPDVSDKKSNLILKPAEVLHIRRANPNSLYWGLSPFVPGRKSILFNRYSIDYLNAFYLKGASPQIALSMDRQASPEAVTRMLRSFEQAYLGRKNMRRTLLLPKGVTASPLDITVADQNLIELIRLNRETIINILRIPKHALGIADTGSLGSEEYKQALKYFYTATIIPILTNFAGAFTKFFADQLKDNYFAFDLSAIPLLKEDEVRKADLAAKMLATHTVNEVRRELYNLGPIPEGDVIIALRPQQLTNQTGVIASPIKELKSLGDEELPIRIKDTHKDWLTETENKVNTYEQEKTPAVKKLTYKYFTAQANIVGEILGKSFKDFNDDIDGIDNSSDMPDSARAIKLAKIRRQLNDAFDELPTAFSDEYTRELRGGVELGNDNTLSLFFSKQDYEAIAAINERNAEGRRKTLEARSITTFQHLNETTTNEIMDTISAGMTKGDSMRQIAGSIFQNFKDQAPMRAERIARTEILTAVSIGNYAASKDAAKVIPDLVKVWVTTMDGRERDSHADLNNKHVDFSEPFANGLMYPRDTKGKADQVINCRCAMVTISRQDLNKLR